MSSFSEDDLLFYSAKKILQMLSTLVGEVYIITIFDVVRRLYLHFNDN